MADTISRLAIQLGMDTALLRKGVGEAQGILRGMTGSLAAITGGLTLGGIAGFGVKLAAEMETASVAFEVMIGDARRAQRLFTELRDFAVATPFEFPELRDASRTLLAMGIAADDVMSTIKVLGDISAGTNQPLNEMASLFGQVAVAGRLTGNELRQFNERGIPLMDALAQRFGVTKAEIRAMVEAGKIGFVDVQAALQSLTGDGGRFENLAARISKTIAGRFSTLSDSAKMAAAQFGSAMVPALAKVVEFLLPYVQALAEVRVETIQNAVKIAAWVGGIGAAIAIIPRIVTGIMSVVTAIRAMASAQAIATALQGPKGWATLAVSLAAAGAAAYGLSQMFAQQDQAATAAAKSSKSAGDSAKEAAAAAIPVVNELAEAQKRRAEVEKETEKTFRGFLDMQQDAERLRESLRTVPEEVAEEKKHAGDLFRAGAIDLNTYGRAMDRANERLRQHAEEARKAADERLRLNEIAAPSGLVRGSSGAQSAIANFQFNNPQGNALLQQIVDLLRQSPVIRGANL